MSSTERHRVARGFNPWRYGSFAIPPELRREIIATELPVIPDERLYGKASHGGSKAPAVPWRLLALGALLASSLVAASLWVWW